MAASRKGRGSRLRTKAAKVQAMTSAIAQTPSSEAQAGPTKASRRRPLKDASFISRIEKPKAPAKRRRPSKKLSTSLQGLAEALPQVAESAPSLSLHLQSLQSKPGVMRRKAKLEVYERKAFENTLVQLVAVDSTPPSDSTQRGGVSSAPSSNRWAALQQAIKSNQGK